jgi:hypothetical protein
MTPGSEPSPTLAGRLTGEAGSRLWVELPAAPGDRAA